MIDDQIINHPKFERQVELEAEMRGLGIEAFKRRTQKNIDRNNNSQNHAGKRLVSAAHEKTLKAIEDFIEGSKTGGAGRKHSALKFLEQIGNNELVAHVTIRAVIDQVFSTPSMSTVASMISSSLEDELNSLKFKTEMPKAWKKFHEKAKTESSARRRRSHLLFPAALLGVEMIEWPDRDKILFGSKMIELFIQATGLAEVKTVHQSNQRSSIILQGTPSTMQWMEEENLRVEWWSPVFMPTLIPPKPWTNVYDGGYWTRYIKGFNLVRTHNREYLDELSNREMPEVYGAINALQETPWQINKAVLEVLQTVWDNSSPLGDLPRNVELDMPTKPHWMNSETRIPREEWTAEQTEEFRAWKAEAHETHVTNAQAKGRRFQLLRMLWVANKFKDEEEFYYPHNVDWRGRAYPVPLFLHPQGNDLQRSLLTFATTTEVGNEENARWLAIHGAGLWGVDKVSMDERVEWVMKNSDAIVASAEDPFNNRFWCEADKPWCALAFAFEWAGFQREGYSYQSSLPIQMDGTCNGLQNFSAMLLDEVGGKAVNLVPGSKPSDIYQTVADVVNEMIERDLSNGEWIISKFKDADGKAMEVPVIQTKDLAAMWSGHVTRKVTKRPVMTLAYGAKKYGFVKQVEEDTVRPWKIDDPMGYPFTKIGTDGQPKDFGGHACMYLGGLIWAAVAKVVIAAREAMDWLQKTAGVASQDGLPINWTTPTGFLVQQAYRVHNSKVLETTFEKVRIQVSYKVGLGKIDSRRQASGISPNWVHSLDASHLMKTINRGHREGITSFSMIHDSYGTHVGNAAALAIFLREEFVQMYSEVNVLEKFKEELEFQVSDPSAIPDLPPKGNLDLTQVLDSEFFFA